MIEFYPDLIVKRKKHVAEQQQEPAGYNSVFGMEDLASDGATIEVWNPSSWDVKRVSANFAASGNKTYSVWICLGRGVVTGKNDKLLIKSDLNGAGGLSTQEVVLTQGFYTGTELAAHVKDRLDATTAFSAVSPWAVSYNASTGLFRVAPSAGKIQFFSVNPSVPVMRSRSTAGSLIGLTANTGMVTAIESDVAVKGLGRSAVYVSGTAVSVMDITTSDNLPMTVDNALVITVAAVNTTMSYEVVYRMLDV